MSTLAEKSKVKTVTDPKVDAAAKEKLVTARIGLLLRQPFFGNLATRMNLINADEWCGTAATDGRNFYYNSRFIMKLRPKEVVFLVGHEVLHVAFDHFGRRSHRDPGWWNMANDYVINGLLIKDNIGKMPTERVPVKDNSSGKQTTSQRVGLYDEKYVGWTSEAVYDDLEKRKVKKELTLDVHLEAGKDGKKGVQGDHGSIGKKGEEGDEGESGKDGLKGYNGASGPPGTKGDQGSPGEKGERGNLGSHGQFGSPGEKGEVGLTGDKGEAGCIY